MIMVLLHECEQHYALDLAYENGAENCQVQTMMIIKKKIIVLILLLG